MAFQVGAFQGDAFQGAASGAQLYYVIGLDAGWTTPTGAAIVAGTGFAASGSETSPTSGATVYDYAALATGLTAGTNYRIAFVWFDGTNYSNVSESAPFTTATLGAAVKFWNGSAWVAKTLKFWNGSVWVAKPLKHWTGAAWA